MNTDNKCLIVSLFILIFFSWLTQYTYTYWNKGNVLLLMALVFIFCLLVILKYAPVSELTQLTDIQRKKRRIMSVVYVIAWFIVSIIFHTLENYFFVIASSFGVFWICMALTPAWYKIFTLIGFARR